MIVSSKLSDSPTYVKTLHQMHIHSPSLILVPDTFLSITDASLASGGKKPSATSVLVQCILEEFDYVPVEPVIRRYWNDTSGRLMCSFYALFDFFTYRIQDWSS